MRSRDPVAGSDLPRRVHGKVRQINYEAAYESSLHLGSLQPVLRNKGRSPPLPRGLGCCGRARWVL